MARLKYKVNGEYTTVGPDFHVTVNQMPTVSAADNGKFARVNSSGEWVAVTVPQSESVAVTATPESQYLMSGSSYLALNNAVNDITGSTGYHNLATLIALLEA